MYSHETETVVSKRSLAGEDGWLLQPQGFISGPCDLMGLGQGRRCSCEMVMLCPMLS